MVLVKVEKRELLRKGKRNNIFALLDEFITSGFECARVEGALVHYVSANSGQCTLNRAIKRNKFGGCKAIVREGELYIIKTDAGEGAKWH